MGTGEIDFGEDDDDQTASYSSAAPSAATDSSIPYHKRPKKPLKIRAKQEPLELEPMERPKRRSVLLAEKLIAECNEEVQFLYDSKTDPSFRCSSATRFRKPKKEEPEPDFQEGTAPRASTSAGTHAAEKTPLSTLEGRVRRSSREAMSVLGELRRSKESRRESPGMSFRALPPSRSSEPSVCGPLARRACYSSCQKLMEGSSNRIPTARRTRPKQANRTDMHPND